MKGLICYFSATGNTKLVVEQLVRRLGRPFDLCDMAKQPVPDLSGYDIVGFASPVDRMAEPPIVREFLRCIPPSSGKPAFLIATYGAIAGRILDNLSAAARVRGFRVVESHALHCPESYPPLVALGLDGAGQPDENNLDGFDEFSDRLKAILADISAGHEIEEYIPHQRLRNKLAPKLANDFPKQSIGQKLVDEKTCTKCGECVQFCPYKVIRLDIWPVFDEIRCRSCWSCYNRCPEKAIYTRKLRGKGHYPGPSDDFKRKLAR